MELHGATNKTKPQHHATPRHNTRQQTRQHETQRHNQRPNSGAQHNVLYNATNRQITTHNTVQRYLTPHTNVQPSAPKHNATTKHVTTQRAPRHITRRDETQHQTNPDATRANGHHETHNPIRARNGTRHNRATQRWAQHGEPTWYQYKTRHATTHYNRTLLHTTSTPPPTTTRRNHMPPPQHDPAQRNTLRRATQYHGNTRYRTTRRHTTKTDVTQQRHATYDTTTQRQLHDTTEHSAMLHNTTNNKNNINRGMAQPAPGTAGHHLTRHNETAQHTLQHDATPHPHYAEQPNASQQGTTWQHEYATPRHKPQSKCRNPT